MSCWNANLPEAGAERLVVFDFDSTRLLIKFLYTALITERTLPIRHANGIVKKKSVLARVVDMKPTMLTTALLNFVPLLF